MKIELTEEAREDVLAAAEYYAGARNRYGQTFDEALEEAALKIADNPNRALHSVNSSDGSGSHAFNGILFTIEENTILITIEMHLHRDPLTWLIQAEND